MGPVAYFADASGAVAGVTRMIPNQSNVSVANLGEDQAEGIKSFVEGKESTIPIDATLGQAITLESSYKKRSLSTLLKVKWLVLLLSCLEFYP